MPRSPELDLAIFVLMTDKTDYITPCACVRGNYIDVSTSIAEMESVTDQLLTSIPIIFNHR